MKLTKKALICAVLLTLALSLLFTGCAAAENAKIEELSLVLTQEDFVILDEFPNLKKLDLSGSECYEAIIRYIESHPDVDVTYSVYLGSDDYSCDVTELELNPGDFDYQELLENLKFLPNVKKISFPGTELTTGQITALNSAYPGIQLEYSAELLGTVYDTGITELDLSSLQPEQVSEVATQLSMFPNVTYVELMDASGKSSLSISDVKTLQSAAPNVTFHYTFTLFGKTVSTTDEVIEYNEVDIGNSGETRIREALDILTGCKQFKLDDCGVDTEVMASLREDYPDIQIDWRIRISYYNICTDETFLRMHLVLDNENAADLKYCTKVKYMDISTNSDLTDISFVSSMPELECLVAYNCPITDLSPLAGNTKLTWLELAYCSKINSLAPLSDCTGLKYLNIGFTNIADLDAVAALSLERFVSMGAPIDKAEQAAFQADHPNCMVRFEGERPYGAGWRYNEDGVTYFEYYETMREIFRYDDNTYYGNRKDRQYE